MLHWPSPLQGPGPNPDLQVVGFFLTFRSRPPECPPQWASLTSLSTGLLPTSVAFTLPSCFAFPQHIPNCNYFLHCITELWLVSSRYHTSSTWAGTLPMTNVEALCPVEGLIISILRLFLTAGFRHSSHTVHITYGKETLQCFWIVTELCQNDHDPF